MYLFVNSKVIKLTFVSRLGEGGGGRVVGKVFDVGVMFFFFKQKTAYEITV